MSQTRVDEDVIDGLVNGRLVEWYPGICRVLVNEDGELCVQSTDSGHTLAVIDVSGGLTDSALAEVTETVNDVVQQEHDRL